MNCLSQPLRTVRGVGPVTEKHLNTLGIHNLRDLLFHLPVRYLDRSHIIPVADVRPGQDCLVRGVMAAPSQLFTRGGRRGVSSRLTDATGSIRCIWFGSASWVSRWAGKEVVIAGRATLRSPPSILHPEIEDFDVELDAYLPVYRSTAGLSQRRLRTLSRTTLDALPETLPSLAPADCAARCTVSSLKEALRLAHYPLSAEQGIQAQERVRLEALIPVQVAVARRRAVLRGQSAPAMPSSVDALASFLRDLPFALTRSQAEALTEIRRDLAAPRPMHRLLQGDVGSGKTVVAAAAGIIALAHGHQVALMAPTEVLADQHGRVVGPWLGRLGYGCALLTGGVSAADRRDIRHRLASGQPLLVVGTHALLQESVGFARLGLVIIDEQHRFGLAQRAMLASKGDSAHLLVMTATPIPRSLAMTVYGHLDLSVLSERPPGRKPVSTAWFDHTSRAGAWERLRDATRCGIQALVVAPLVEESESLEARGAVELYHDLSRGALRDVSVGLVHGRMKAADKDDAVEAFRSGSLQVLVCTTVVEVGLDARGAGMLLVDGAERFGLSQLHQLRGRIGRGGQDAECLLITGEEITDDAAQRIQALLTTDDGFRLAELDLALRGPGALLGPAQHGRFADALCADPRLVVLAKECARRIVESGAPPDPDLEGVLRGLEDSFALEAG